MKPTTDTDTIPLPVIDPHAVVAVTEWLFSRETMQRRPEATAKLLVLAVKLHQIRRPWPTRPAVAGHLGVSLPLVDVAISQRRASGLLKMVIETTRGHVKQRASVVTQRFLEPSDELIKVVEDAERESRKIALQAARAKAPPEPAPALIEEIFTSWVESQKPKKRKKPKAPAKKTSGRSLARAIAWPTLATAILSCDGFHDRLFQLPCHFGIF